MFREKIFQTLWENILCSPQERVALKSALEECSPSLTLRRFVALLPLHLLEAEHRLQLKDDFSKEWGTLSPFGQVPVRQAFVIACYVSTYLYPNTSIRHSLTKMLKNLLNKYNDSFFIQTFLKSHEHQFFLFIETLPSFIKLYSNFNSCKDREISIENLKLHTYILYVKSPESKIRAYIIPSVIEAFFDLFHVTGEVHVQILPENLLEMTITWEPLLS